MFGNEMIDGNMKGNDSMFIHDILHDDMSAEGRRAMITLDEYTKKFSALEKLEQEKEKISKLQDSIKADSAELEEIMKRYMGRKNKCDLQKKLNDDAVYDSIVFKLENYVTVLKKRIASHKKELADIEKQSGVMIDTLDSWYLDTIEHFIETLKNRYNSRYNNHEVSDYEVEIIKTMIEDITRKLKMYKEMAGMQ